MSLFKKKVECEAIKNIKKQMEQAKECKSKYFYYKIEEEDIKEVRRWAARHNIAMDAAYVLNAVIYYKFYGWSV